MSSTETQTENIIQNPEEEQFNQEAAQNQEAARSIPNELVIAYHGIRASIADKRMNFSGRRMEKMDHKNALYADMSAKVKMTKQPASKTASGKPAVPRTNAERAMDSRLEKKRFKKSVADTYIYRAERVFGNDPNRTRPNAAEKRKQRHEVRDSYERGEIFARDRDDKLADIEAQTPLLGELMTKQARKKHRRAQNSLNRADRQPVLSRWRASRQKESVRDIKRHHARAEKHRTKINERRPVPIAVSAPTPDQIPAMDWDTDWTATPERSTISSSRSWEAAPARSAPRFEMPSARVSKTETPPQVKREDVAPTTTKEATPKPLWRSPEEYVPSEYIINLADTIATAISNAAADERAAYPDHLEKDENGKPLAQLKKEFWVPIRNAAREEVLARIPEGQREQAEADLVKLKRSQDEAKKKPVS
jgi:hypothetical protein